MKQMCRTNNQSGRSMIEMLGVLAIIGVLSVGGIAGYSKAMMKFKINKTIDQISQMVANTRTLYARQRNYGNLNEKVAYKANLAPREMFEGGSGDYSMTHPFGGNISIFSTGRKNDVDNRAFGITVYGLPEEACIELVTQDWGDTSSSGLLSVGINSGVILGAYEGCDGQSATWETYACPNGNNVATPMPIDVAVTGCDACSSLYGSCSLSLRFY